ncbi:hypothetical protein HWV62_6329 [Athelia sp. TMB]|nr:hypothetical protein HWV62_6329 [Athelia sp. TMB]
MTSNGFLVYASLKMDQPMFKERVGNGKHAPHADVAARHRSKHLVLLRSFRELCEELESQNAQIGLSPWVHVLKEQLQCFSVLSQRYNLVARVGPWWWRESLRDNCKVVAVDFEQHPIARSERHIGIFCTD